jgi:predicted CoA-binding protein
MNQPSVAIIGASRDRRKFGNKSVRAHLAAGYDVYPVNPHAGQVEGLACYPDLSAVPVDRVDRVSLYVPPEVGVTLLAEIAAAGPAEVWLNPGSGSRTLREAAQRLGLNFIDGCSIVALGLSPADFP